MKKKVLFIPQLSYLSNPLYEKLNSVNTRKYLTAYLNPSFPFSVKENKDNYSEESFSKAFDYYYKIDDYYFDQFLPVYFRSNNIKKAKVFYKFVALYREYKKSLHAKLDEIKPDIIVLVVDLTSVSLLVNNWAIKKGIPVVILQSAFLNINKPSLLKKIKNRAYYLGLNKLLGLPFVGKQLYYGCEEKTNYLFLWGDFFSKIIYDINANKEVHYIGNPIYDTLLSSINNSKKNEIAKSNKRPTISIFTEASSEIQLRETSEDFKKLILDNNNWYFIIKVHPRGNLSFYLSLLGSLEGNNYIVVQKKENTEIYNNSKVHISRFSSTSFEAVIAKTPIILYKRGLIETFDYFNNEIELRADTYNELVSCINKALTDEYKKDFMKRRKSFLEARLASLDGRSTERFYQALDSVLKHNN